MRKLLLVAIGAFVACALPCPAQSLQRLTVQTFTLASDTPQPRLEVPFHLVLTLRVRERVSEIDNLVLPILAAVELQGDERHYEVGPSGTLYRETITVVAHHTGRITIAPATLQAIDARDGREKQWYSNGLTLDVGGGSLLPIRGVGRTIAHAARLAFVVLLWGVGILCGIAVLLLLFRQRRSAPVAVAVRAPAPPVPAPVPVRTRRAQLEDALTVLRAERSRTAAVRVRAAVWHMLGVSEGATLDDVLRSPEAGDARMRTLLRSLERGAFTYDDDLRPAVDAACDALEGYLA
jgi:hypothetical protein